MSTGIPKTNTPLLHAAMLIALAVTSVILQSCNANTSTVTTSQSANINSSPAAQIYPPQSDKHTQSRKLLLAGHYQEYVQRLGQYGAEGDMQCQDELGNLYDWGRIVAQDRKKAIDIWRELAVKNYGPAMCELSTMYMHGYAVPKDYKKASALLTRATNLGCDFGTFGTAYMYRDGVGCKRDYAKALALYEELCAKNSPLGWYGKGKLLWNGWGVKEDPTQSIALMQKAAEAGLPFAQSWLADRYYYGGKIPVDYKLSRLWAQRGSDQGDVECQLRLASLKMRGLGGEKDAAGGISLLKALADQSILEAQNQLGHACRMGEFVDKDLVAAKMWLEIAAARNYVRSINELADMYFQGDGVPKNLEKFFELNLKGANETEANSADRASCQYNVGSAYDHGLGIRQDFVQARIWYTKAADAGNPHACNNLSFFYLGKHDVPVNERLAMSLRRRGVENGCWMACTNLGKSYVYGTEGVTKNIPEAVRLFKKSIDLVSEGNQYANYELGRIYEKGLVGKADVRLALQYYREAAKYGSAPATVRVSALKDSLPPVAAKH